MNQSSFVMYVMGYRLNLTPLALARFALERYLGKHASASPSSGANQTRTNSLKFSIASKSTIAQASKNKLQIALGVDKNVQAQKF